MEQRREFIKKILAAGTLPVVLPSQFHPGYVKDFSEKDSVIKVSQPGNALYYKPLENIKIWTKEGGIITVYDSEGDYYFRDNINENIEFRVGGAIGNQAIVLSNDKDRILDIKIIKADTKTFIADEKKEFSKLLDTMYRTMISTSYGNGRKVFYNGDYYTYFSSWFQDHVYVMKGMKYFYPEWKSGIDLYAEAQREDGMIHDNYKHKYEHDGSWSWRFDYGDFVYIPEDPRSSCIFVRVPVENMAEFTFMEGLYYTWKNTGDDEWMKSRLDNAIKAVEYATTDPYRWSSKYQLLKRGYTIDIWDFQTKEDSAIAGNDTMRVYLDKTRFGIMFGDNVRMAASCGYLAEMLNYSGRAEEAKKIRTIGEGIRKRINELSWNGEFYTHHIPEDPSIKRDLGVDENSQVVLSNAYALGAGIDHTRASAIIETYQRIRKEKPESALAEWYTCFPPFEKGFHVEKWNYMNGGITPIVAGELARGAFEHGYESYAVDILRRTYEVAQLRNDKLEGCYKGYIEPEPDREFQPLKLDSIANADLGRGNDKVPGWTGEPGNDMTTFPVGNKIFEKIPFYITNPNSNNKKAVLALSGDKKYKLSESIELNKEFASIYFLHVLPEGSNAGSVTLKYKDGSEYIKYITKGGGEIGPWWFPQEPQDKKGIPRLKLAWTGKNETTTKIGCWVYGLNNPHPEKIVDELVLEGMKDSSKWMIMGITLSDKPVYFEPSIVSTIPAHWAAAAVTYALIEGLTGVVDEGVAYSQASVSPRWSFADVKNATVSVKYEASGGYVHYTYRDEGNNIKLQFTSNSDESEIKLPIPMGKSPGGLLVNGNKVPYKLLKIKESLYAITKINSKGVFTIELNLS
ncbi:MAG: hypothetical protein ACP5E3_03525 [Bacteroidales bacterium]